MKKYLLGALFGGISTCAIGQAATYVPIPYYGNNPFLFCTLGVPQDCWFPISKELGTFGVSNYYCFNPVSAALFASVCPRAFGPAAMATTAAGAAVVVAGAAANASSSSSSSSSNSGSSSAPADPADASPQSQPQSSQPDPAAQSLEP